MAAGASGVPGDLAANHVMVELRCARALARTPSLSMAASSVRVPASLREPATSRSVRSTATGQAGAAGAAAPRHVAEEPGSATGPAAIHRQPTEVNRAMDLLRRRSTAQRAIVQVSDEPTQGKPLYACISFRS